MRRGLLFACLIAALVACDDEPPQASGRLLRPSGMAYVERPPENAGTSTVVRADLVIADSEAQGIRVLQLEQRGGTRRTEFVLAPVVFFPLAIPAPGFPTDVAISRGDDPSVFRPGDNDRVYALSPASGVLHVLDVRMATFGTSVTLAEPQTYRALDQLSLDGLVPEPATPVDVETIAAAGEGDVVLVALDVIGADHGVLAALTVVPSDGGFSIASVETTTIAAVPTEITVRTSTPAAVLVSSAGSSFISVVRLDPAPTTGRVFADSLRIDAGGPTREVVDAGEAGLVALRVDRPAAVIFEPSAGGFIRSPRVYRTPYDAPSAPGATAEPGVMTLRTAAVSGALGALPFLPSTELNASGGVVDLFEPSRSGPPSLLGADQPVVMLVHMDGILSFLFGSPLELASVERGRVEHVDRLVADDLSVAGCGVAAPLVPGLSNPLTCEESVARADNESTFETMNMTQLAAACDASVIGVDAVVPRSVSATYRGALRIEQGGLMRRVSTATTSLRYVLVPGGLGAFDPDVVRVSDLVMVALRPPPGCQGVPAEIVGTGTIASVIGEELRVEFAPTASLLGLAECGEVAIDRYEVFPAGEEFVVAATNDPRQHYERVPVTVVDGESRAELRAVVSTQLTSQAGFTCTEASRTVSCSTDADCFGGSCQASTAAGCSGACAAYCSAGGCPAQGPERVCSGVRFELTPTRPSLVDGSGVVSAAAADDVVFSPLRNAWFVSFPGSRAVTEIGIDSVTGMTSFMIR